MREFHTYVLFDFYRSRRLAAYHAIQGALAFHDRHFPSRSTGTLYAMPSMVYRGAEQYILKSLSTLDYDRAHYTTMHSRWTIGRQAGLRRDNDFMAGKTAVSARSLVFRLALDIEPLHCGLGLESARDGRLLNGKHDSAHRLAQHLHGLYVGERGDAVD